MSSKKFLHSICLVERSLYPFYTLLKNRTIQKLEVNEYQPNFKKRQCVCRLLLSSAENGQGSILT